MVQNDAIKNFENELDLQLLKSEKQRLLFLGVLFAFGLVSYLRQLFWNWENLDSLNIFYLILPLLSVLTGVLFEFTLFIFTTIRLKKANPLPGWIYTVSFLVDLLFPTVVIISLMHLTNPFLGLSSSSSYVFFVFIVLSILRLHFWPSMIVGIGCALIYTGLIQYGFWLNMDSFPENVWKNPLYMYGRAFIMFFTGFIVGIIAHQIRKRTEAAIQQNNEKSRILHTFGQHVSPEVVNQLMNQSYEIESRDVTILFLDIRNFTAYSENRSPIEVIGRLNEIFAFMIDFINKNHGIINKFLGDGFMAVFGAPIQKGNNEQNAVKAASEIIEELDRRNKLYSEEAFEVGIGIHSGEAVTGTVGSPARKEYTIIGDVVNLTSRLEALNKKFNTRVLISERVYKSSELSEWSQYKVEQMPPVQVRGRKDLLNTYKIY